MLTYTAALAMVIIISDDLAVLDYNSRIRAIHPAGKAMDALLRDENRALASPIAGFKFLRGAAARYNIPFRERLPSWLYRFFMFHIMIPLLYTPARSL